MDASQELVMQIVALNWGIAPICESVKEVLEQMDPEDARKKKRKYRKIKRKALRAFSRQKGFKLSSHYANQLVIREIHEEAKKMLAPKEIS